MSISICSKAELQHDLVPHGTNIASSTLTDFSASIDQNGHLVVFMIDGSTNTVYRATRSLEVDGNSSPTWVVEDTQFPSLTVTQPRLLDSFVEVLPPGSSSKTRRIFCAVIGANNEVYFLNPDLNFPTWIVIPNHSGSALSQLKFHTTTDYRTILSVRTEGGQMLFAEPGKNGSELMPLKVLDDTTSDFDAGPAFARSKMGSLATWGYITSGMVQLNDPPYVSDSVDISSADGDKTRRITLGKYTSVTYAAPDESVGTAPLLFAIDRRKRPTYFKANGKGGFDNVLPFGTTFQCNLLRAMYRKGLDEEKNTIEWVDLFAVDDSGKLWHSRSLGKSPIQHLPNGDIAISGWCTPTVILHDALALELAGHGSGPAFLVVRRKGTHPLTLIWQDPVSTAWGSYHLRPAITRENKQDVDVGTHRVFYVVMTVYKDGGKVANHDVKIDAPEQCEIEINGVVTTVGPNLQFSTKTNSFGDVSITIPARLYLGCPSLSAWADGMDSQYRVDVVPSGSIMKKFKDITQNELANARDPTDDQYVFSGVSSRDLGRLAKGLNKIGEKFTPQNCDCATATGENLGKMYIHPATLPEISRCRHVSEPHFSRVFTRSRCTKCNPLQPPYKTVDDEKKEISSDGQAEEVNFSWGDLWRATAIDELDVDNVDLDPQTGQNIDLAVDAGLAVQVTLHGHGESAKKVWNGIVHFVEQGFDIVGNWFKSLGSTMRKAFHWLAYLFNWSDIKSTAAGFRKTFHNQIDKIQDLLEDTRPKLDTFFTKAKTWLDDNLDGAIDEAKQFKIADYDDPSDNPTSITQLPSSSSWLSNKVMNVVTMSPTPGLPVNDTVKAAWVKFMKKLYDLGVSSFDSTFEDVSEFFSNISSKSNLDGFTIADLIKKVFKGIANVFLDFAGKVMDDVIEVAIATLDAVEDFFDTTLDMPVLSAVFKKIGLDDLSLLNLISLPLAVPATILYKAFTGHVPYWNENSEPVQIAASTDPLLIWTLILNLLYGGLDGTNDLFSRMHLDLASNLVTGFCWFVACLQTGLGLYSSPFNDRTNYANVASAISCAIGISSFVSSFIEPRFFQGGQNFFVKIVRALVPVGTGVAMFGSAVWHIVNMFVTDEEDDSNRDIAVGVGEHLFCLPSIAKVLGWTENPKLTLALLIVDVAGYSASTVAFGIAQYNN